MPFLNQEAFFMISLTSTEVSAIIDLMADRMATMQGLEIGLRVR